VIIGSANINQRSMEGTRDTEIAMGAYQPQHTWANTLSAPRGQVMSFSSDKLVTWYAVVSSTVSYLLWQSERQKVALYFGCYFPFKNTLETYIFSHIEELTVLTVFLPADFRVQDVSMGGAHRSHRRELHQAGKPGVHEAGAAHWAEELGSIFLQPCD